MYTTIGNIEITMTKNQALSASHPGPCDDDVHYLSQHPSIKRQLKKIDPDTLVKSLKEYGTWDIEELKDHEENLQRLVWLAACDIAEGL